MKKGFWLILILTVGTLIGAFALFNNSGGEPSTNTANHQEIRPDEHIRGNPQAKVTLVEYGDFQCPACKAAFPLVKQLLDEYGDRVRLVFRHFPIAAIHPNAFAGSRAAEAAGTQGKFFEMHDLLYERQDKWASSTSAQQLFRDYAGELGLNLEQFNTAYSEGSTTDRINGDIELGKAAGATGTPTFILDGQKLEPNPRSYEELKAKIEAALAQAGG